MTARVWPDLHSPHPEAGDLFQVPKTLASKQPLHQYMQHSPAPI